MTGPKENAEQAQVRKSSRHLLPALVRLSQRLRHLGKACLLTSLERLCGFNDSPVQVTACSALVQLNYCCAGRRKGRLDPLQHTTTSCRPACCSPACVSECFLVVRA